MSDLAGSREPIVGEWGGLPLYQCPLCSFNTLDADLLDDHLRGSHHEPEALDPGEETTLAEPSAPPEEPVVEKQDPPDLPPPVVSAPPAPIAPPATGNAAPIVKTTPTDPSNESNEDAGDGEEGKN